MKTVLTKKDNHILSVCKEQTNLLMTSLMSENDYQLALIERDLTIEKAVEGTLVNTLSRADDKTTIKVLVYLISRMNDSFSMSNRLNENQILMLAIDIIDTYPSETIEDLVLMFKMARQGKLGGKIYRLDSHVIFQEWVKKYLELKSEVIEKEHEEKKKDNIVNVGEWGEESKKMIHKISVELQMNNKSRSGKTETHEEYIESLKADCKNYADKEIKYFIGLWKKQRGTTEYIEVLENELKSRGK